MLLQRLKEYAEAGRVDDMAPDGYIYKPIRYVIELDATGQPLGIVDQAQGSSAKDKRGRLMPAPEVGRTSRAIRPRIFADNSEYVLGKARSATPTRKATTPERAEEVHEAFVDLVHDCASVTREPAVKTVENFLAQVDSLDAFIPSDFDLDANITFSVDGIYPIDLPSVRQFWAMRINPPAAGDLDENSQEVSATKAIHLQCIVCGKPKPAMKRLAYKWKGIYGGQSSGLALISADADAFESYGLENSLIAPTCAECGELFSKAANDLLSKDDTRIRVGPTTHIFWTREEVGFNFGTLITDPTPQHIQAFYRSPHSAQRGAIDVDDTPFYAAALSASGARVVVRDWLDTTVGTVKGYLLRYFRLQEIVDRFGEEPTPLGIRSLAGATVRDPMKDAAPLQVTRELLHLALSGGPVPRHLLFEAVRRCRAAGDVRRPQAALIKMVLLSERERQPGEGAVADQELVRLDPGSQSPAYLCGRLLTVLESIQRAALGDVNATIVDRYFGTASSAPAAVFGKLLRGAQPHLGKLRRDRPGSYRALQQRLEEVQAGLQGFPKTLSLTDQGLFALGYYHQRAADRAGAAAARARRDAQLALDLTPDAVVTPAASDQ